MPLPTFADVAQDAPDYIARITRSNGVLKALETDTGTPLRRQLESTTALDVAADTVWVAYLTTDPAVIVAHVFTLVDLLEVMLDHQRRKFTNALASPQHIPIAVAAARYLDGEITASDVAAQVGTSVPAGRPPVHPKAAAEQAARAITVYSSGAHTATSITPPQP